MHSNLKTLERKASGSSAGSRSGKIRATIQRKMKRHKCGQPDRRIANLQDRGNFFQKLFSSSNNARSRARTDARERRRNSIDILDQIFGGSADAERLRQARLDRQELERQRRTLQGRQIWSTAKRLKNYNTFRTVCVRKCDGYYFPVSFSTNADGLENDANACAYMCPGTEMELFTHHTSRETAEDMVSIIDGTPYTELANAFAHQEQFDPKCSCDFSLLKRSYNIDIPDSVILDKLSKGLRNQKTPLPTWREDTASNKPKYFKPSSKVAKASKDRKKRPVRVIGDAFFPTQ